MNLEIRDVRQEDLGCITNLVADTWNVRRFINNEEILYAAIKVMYINPILNNSTFGKVATLNGQIVGTIFGSRDGEIPSFRLLQEDNTEELLKIMQLDGAERMTFVNVTSKTIEAYISLLNEKQVDFQGCLEFFAVSEEARGKKIGKRLLNEFFSYLREKNTNKIYVYTDTMSSFGFYDYNGFVCLDKVDSVLELPDGEYKKTDFIYEYTF
ncbi:GNAT family N-acetyltransferase [Paenibacillus polymyxa]|uniref:GNAT family N-acetyltransferase n=1 Tax=Paenibacillus polymyxa TaxID=1406 RepID=UPI0025B6AAB3|nr:GNAT family N-acetyltransferase [Paenibacillus polymyxa]MDN4081273.1 GNAT family N-acetyltransferase [Paenibacillus polymyxa]MDN4106976.1 GNAT family N-acetyltransferase [Paenibacillus polymyxa]MDN4116938.1 GNAT family N-acetyltransferase [Paenibacillus polymyxa]